MLYSATVLRDRSAGQGVDGARGCAVGSARPDTDTPQACTGLAPRCNAVGGREPQRDPDAVDGRESIREPRRVSIADGGRESIDDTGREVLSAVGGLELCAVVGLDDV